MTLHCVLVVLAHGHLRSLLDFGSDEGRDETLFPWNGNDTRLDDFMLQFSKSTRTRDLREYLFPSSANCADGDVDLHYRLFSGGCKVSNNCYCDHVAGSMAKELNKAPAGCAGSPDKGNATPSPQTFTPCGNATCSCLVEKESNGGCLFSDMKASKILAVVSVARALKVSHVIECGRYGGLSALMYARLGLSVDSVEYLPLDMVSRALNSSKKDIHLYDGDDRTIVPELLMKRNQSTRAGVIFDGSKRFQAYEIYKKIKDQVAFAVFDDANKDGKFAKFLINNERFVWWSSAQNWLDEYKSQDRRSCGLDDLQKSAKLRFAGGISGVNRMEFAIVFRRKPYGRKRRRRKISLHPYY